MADIVPPETRSRMMAGIRGTNTKPEIQIRKGLHARGFRYRLHGRKLPGKPDLVLRRHGAVIFVDGCFWHGHDCHLFKWPKSREEFWRNKIGGNISRDMKNRDRLADDGWRIATVRECALKGKTRRDPETVIAEIENWLTGNSQRLEIAGA